MHSILPLDAGAAVIQPAASHAAGPVVSTPNVTRASAAAAGTPGAATAVVGPAAPAAPAALTSTSAATATAASASAAAGYDGASTSGASSASDGLVTQFLRIADASLIDIPPTKQLRQRIIERTAPYHGYLRMDEDVTLDILPERVLRLLHYCRLPQIGCNFTDAEEAVIKRALQMFVFLKCATLPQTADPRAAAGQALLEGARAEARALEQGIFEAVNPDALVLPPDAVPAVQPAAAQQQAEAGEVMRQAGASELGDSTPPSTSSSDSTEEGAVIHVVSELPEQQEQGHN